MENPMIKAECLEIDDIDPRVHIYVIREGHDTHETPTLEVSPTGQASPRVYHRDSPHVVRPTRPTQVRWCVHGLRANETITLESENPRDKIFPHAPYLIEHPDNTIVSGPAQRHEAKDISWYYKIVWTPSRGKVVEYARQKRVELDPIVIIKEDP